MRSINTICIRIRIMSEKFCLQWDDFQGNIKEVLGMFKGDLDFADVTLACEDGKQVAAHKVIAAHQICKKDAKMHLVTDTMHQI